jgi:hypothetical protein
VIHPFRWLFVILQPNNKLCIVNYELKNMMMKKIFMAAILCCATAVVNATSREIVTAPNASYLWYIQPQVYNDTVKRFEEFINKK